MKEPDEWWQWYIDRINGDTQEFRDNVILLWEEVAKIISGGAPTENHPILSKWDAHPPQQIMNSPLHSAAFFVTYNSDFDKRGPEVNVMYFRISELDDPDAEGEHDWLPTDENRKKRAALALKFAAEIRKGFKP